MQFLPVVMCWLVNKCLDLFLLFWIQVLFVLYDRLGSQCPEEAPPETEDIQLPQT